jgi:hypothetical protein
MGPLQDAPAHRVEVIRPNADAPSLAVRWLSTRAIAVAPRCSLSADEPLGARLTVRRLTGTNTPHEHGFSLDPGVAFVVVRAGRLHATRRLEHATDRQSIRQLHTLPTLGALGLFARGDTRGGLVVTGVATIAGRTASRVFHPAGPTTEEVIAEQPRLAGVLRAPRQTLTAFPLTKPACEHASLDPRARWIRGESTAHVALGAVMISRAVASKALNLSRLVVPDAGRAGRAVQADLAAQLREGATVLAGRRGSTSRSPRWSATRQPRGWCFTSPSRREGAPLRVGIPGVARMPLEGRAF